MKKEIENLDLECIKGNLCDKESGLNWDLEKANHIEILYKSFLFIKFKYPNEKIIPTKDIDCFWHYHILDTRKYMDDCNNIFGCYLHHFPYFGKRGEEDKKNLERCFKRTLFLVKKDFPELIG